MFLRFCANELICSREHAPVLIIQDMQQHKYTNRPMQNARIAILNAINDNVEKRAKAAAIDAEPVTPLPLRDASVVGGNAPQKEG